MMISPIFQAEAKRFIATHHRHSGAPLGMIACVSVRPEPGGEVRGVAVLGRPIARRLQDGVTAEILRVCTLGDDNACSMLYGAMRRVASALGYRRVVTYTLGSEGGASLRASGFRASALVPAAASWSCPSRPRIQTDLFGSDTRPPQAKIRWEWP